MLTCIVYPFNILTIITHSKPLLTASYSPLIEIPFKELANTLTGPY